MGKSSVSCFFLTHNVDSFTVFGYITAIVVGESRVINLLSGVLPVINLAYC